MRYNLKKELKRKSFAHAVRRAWEQGSVVDFSPVTQRSLKQNSYFHVCIAYLAKEYGEDASYFKQIVLKQEWCPDIFKVVKFDVRLGKNVTLWKSSRDLTKEEMSRAIDTLRYRAAKDMNVYIPLESEEELVKEMERETWD